MRANVIFKWNANNPNVETHKIIMLNVFGRSFDQVAERATNEAREELLKKEPNWDGVDPAVDTIEITSHGAE